MEILKYSLNKNQIQLPGFIENKNFCFLDIETTGLSRKYNEIYLAGIVYYNNILKDWELVQYFANSLDKEELLLERLVKDIANFDCVITYNGQSFDIPFIKSRLKHYNLENKLNSLNNFDIYRKLRREAPYLNLENLKLKTVEESLGIYREDKYTGKDCINFYYQYTKNQDQDLKEKILQHNYDDLFYLLDILKIFHKLEKIKTIDLKIENDILSIKVLDIKTKEDIFTINCITSPLKSKMDFVYYGDNFNLHWKDQQFLTIDIDIRKGLITPAKKCFFIHKEDLPIGDLNDLSKFMVPRELMLLMVENGYVIDNIKNIIKKLVLYVLK